jgi:hypothetical protein
MRLIIFAFVFAVAAAPASATTYSWPLQVSLPVSISGATTSGVGLNLQLQCKYYPAAGGGGYQFNGLWITPTITGNVVSFSQTMNFSVSNTAAKNNGAPAAAPLSGDKIVCTVAAVRGTLQSSGSKSSTLILP